MVLPSRRCVAIKDDGERCQAAPLADGTQCFWHAEETAKDAAEARRLGGLRRRRERAVGGAYLFDGLETVPAIRRLLEIAAVDVLSTEASLSRARTLVYVAAAATKLLETSELERRLVVLEQVVGQQALTAALRADDAIDGAVLFTVEDDETDAAEEVAE
jgi:hypothetical protein